MVDDDEDVTGDVASSPCMAREFGVHDDPAPMDPGKVAQWRKAERARLRAARMAVPVAERSRIAAAIAEHMDGMLAQRFGDVSGRRISGYWPIKGEPDLRGWLTSLHEKGVVVLLPVVETRAAPLVFRRWTPGMKMERGHWNIPVPPESAERLTPEIALSPLVGWDREGYRLGYGGGYFDRTLAAADPRPFVVGVGLHEARIGTIYPQPHDIPMSVIVTEAGIAWQTAMR